MAEMRKLPRLLEEAGEDLLLEAGRPRPVSKTRSAAVSRLLLALSLIVNLQLEYFNMKKQKNTKGGGG